MVHFQSLLPLMKNNQDHHLTIKLMVLIYSNLGRTYNENDDLVIQVDPNIQNIMVKNKEYQSQYRLMDLLNLIMVHKVSY